MSNKITAGEAYVTVSVDCKDLLKGLQEASQKIAQTAREISAVTPDLSPTIKIDPAPAKAALSELRESVQKTAQDGRRLSDFFTVTAGDVARFIQGAVGTLTSALGATGDKFDKMSQRVGLSAEALSEYAHAASMCGADLSNVEGALRSMASLTLNANNGIKKSSDTFKRLGIDLEYFNKLDTERQFEYLAEKIAGVPDPTLRAAEAMKVFGSDGQRLLPLFNSGTDGLRQLREEARSLGATFDEDSAKMGADYVDATTRMKEAVVGLGNSIARALTPAVVSTANFFARLIAWASQFVRDHPTLTKAFLAVTSGVGGFAFSMAAATKISAAWTTTLKQLKDAAFALKGTILRLWGVIAAHPILAAVAALGALLIAIKAINEIKGPKMRFEAQDAYSQGENDRRDDANAVKRLEELREKQKLTNVEIVEATALVAKLNARYGEVGYVVDQVTGKITAAKNAQAELNKKVLEGRAAQLRTAIEEKNKNIDSGAFAKEQREKALPFTQLWLKSYLNPSAFAKLSFGMVDSARKDILAKDANFRAESAGALGKELADIASMQAELNALVAQLEKPMETFAEVDESVFGAADDFIKAGTKEVEKSVEESCREIDENAAKLREAFLKLADPTGAMTDKWGDAAARAAFFKDNAEAEEYYKRVQEINASAEAQKRELRARQQAERDAAQKQIDAELKRARETEDARTRSDRLNPERRRFALQKALGVATANNQTELADDLRRRLARVDVDVERDRQIDAINKETEAYKKQLQAVIDLEEAKKQTDPGNYNAGLVDSLQARIKSAEDDAERRRQEARDAADAKQTEKEQNALQGAFDRIFEKFATPFEKLQKASEELQAAYAALNQAQESKDATVIASALDRLGESQEKYLSAQEAAANVGSAVKSLGGTFNAWQAASLTSQINYDKQLYNETRTQTRYLIDIARNTREKIASFQ